MIRTGILPRVVWAIALLALGVIRVRSAEQTTVPAVDLDKMVSYLTELGLPDTRGAKWVMMHSFSHASNDQLIETNGAQLEGNAWLLPDSKEAIVGQCTKSPVPKQIPPQPANLDHDIGMIRAALSNQDLTSRDEAPNFGALILFIAHLHNQGKRDVTLELLPKVFAASPSPEVALNSAIGALADSRVAEISTRWCEDGDSVRAARDLQAACDTFHRGWPHRDGALLLLGRFSGPNTSTLDPESEALAKLLVSMPASQLSKAPLHGFWIFDGWSGESRRMYYPSAETEGVEEKFDPRLVKLFSGGLAAAMKLAKLLDDKRLVRFPNTFQSRISYSRNSPGEQSANEQYDDLMRPMELGTFVRGCLEELQPSGVRDYSDSNAKLKDWIESLGSKSVEDAAFDLMAACSEPYETAFGASLGFLVDRKLAHPRLKLVFTDPAIWGENSFEDIGRCASEFVRQADVGDKNEYIKAVMTAAREGSDREVNKTDDAEYRKSLRQRADHGLAVLDAQLNGKPIPQQQEIDVPGEEDGSLVRSIFDAIFQ